MTTNRFGASPVITGNFVSLDVIAGAPSALAPWPNRVNTPITLTDDSPDQFVVATLPAASKTLVNLPEPSAQNEGKTFFVKIGSLGAASTGLTVQAPPFGGGALASLAALLIAGDFVILECQDQTPVGGPISYGWTKVLCVINGAWVA